MFPPWFSPLRSSHIWEMTQEYKALLLLLLQHYSSFPRFGQIRRKNRVYIYSMIFFYPCRYPEPFWRHFSNRLFPPRSTNGSLVAAETALKNAASASSVGVAAVHAIDLGFQLRRTADDVVRVE